MHSGDSGEELYSPSLVDRNWRRGLERVRHTVSPGWGWGKDLKEGQVQGGSEEPEAGDLRCSPQGPWPGAQRRGMAKFPLPAITKGGVETLGEKNY